MLWYLEEFVSISEMPGWVGWDGKGRDVMGWEWGWGEVRHVEKVGKIKRLLPTNHPQASLASAGQLVAPLGLLFALLFITWGVLVPSWAKAPNKYENQTEISAKIDAKRDAFLAYLSADEH